MAVQIIIDSSSDLLKEEVDSLGLMLIPLIVSFGDKEYKDVLEISHKEFFEKLIESDTLPTTSQINPAIYGDIIQSVLDKGDTPLLIVLSGELSGSYQSACIAASDFDEEVYVIDSRNATLGIRVLIMRAVELRDQGLPAREIAEILEKEKKSIRLLAMLDTLEYLKKGGRISAATAFAGGVLNIKPVVEVIDGEVKLVGKARGSKNANNLLREMINNSRGIDFDRPISLAYSGLSDIYIQKYLNDSRDLWEQYGSIPPISTVGAVIGTHVGPGAIAVSFFERE